MLIQLWPPPDIHVLAVGLFLAAIAADLVAFAVAWRRGWGR